VKRKARSGNDKVSFAASGEVAWNVDEPSFCDIEKAVAVAAPAACLADMVKQQHRKDRLRKQSTGRLSSSPTFSHSNAFQSRQPITNARSPLGG
jgi:hypothetical protein